MKNNILLLLFILPLCVNSILPTCNVSVIFVNGYPDFGATIRNCSLVSPSPFNAPSYFINESAVEVDSNFVLNNFISTNDIIKTIKFDCKFRLQWHDNRFNLPQLFDFLNPIEINNGIEVNDIIRDSANPMAVWLPNIHFVDAQEVLIIAETIRIKLGGTMYWSRHVVLTLTEENMVFENYPTDTQNFLVKFESYSLPSTMQRMLPPKVDFYVTIDGEKYNFHHSATWSYNSYTSSVQNINYGTDEKPRTFSVALLSINMTRISKGIVLRLVQPIFSILIMAGMIFWADPTQRVQLSVTLTLVLLTIYVLIFSSLPDVGYITKFDKYRVLMSVILFVCIILHRARQFCMLSNTVIGQNGEEIFVINPFYTTFILTSEFFGRLIILPLTGLTFLFTFEASLTEGQYNLGITMCIGFLIMFLIFESRKIKESFILTFIEVYNKPEILTTLNKFHIVLFNLYHYKILSNTLTIHRKNILKETKLKDMNGVENCSMHNL